MSDNKIQSGLSSLKKWAGLDETPKADAPLKPAVDTCTPQPKPAAEPARDSFSASDVMDGARDFLKKVGNTASDAISRDLPITGMPTQTIAELAAGAQERIGEVTGKLKEVSPGDVRDAAMQARELILSSKDQLVELTRPQSEKISDRLAQLPDMISNARVGIEQELAVQKASVELLGEVISVGVPNFLDHQMGELGIPRDQREALTLLNETVSQAADRVIGGLSETDLMKLAAEYTLRGSDAIDAASAQVDAFQAKAAPLLERGVALAELGVDELQGFGEPGLTEAGVISGTTFTRDAVSLLKDIAREVERVMPDINEVPAPIAYMCEGISLYKALSRTEELLNVAVEVAPRTAELIAMNDPVVISRNIDKLEGVGDEYARKMSLAVSLHLEVGGSVSEEIEHKIVKLGGDKPGFSFEVTRQGAVGAGIGVETLQKGVSLDGVGKLHQLHKFEVTGPKAKEILSDLTLMASLGNTAGMMRLAESSEHVTLVEERSSAGLTAVGNMSLFTGATGVIASSGTILENGGRFDAYVMGFETSQAVGTPISLTLGNDEADTKVARAAMSAAMDGSPALQSILKGASPEVQQALSGALDMAAAKLPMGGEVKLQVKAQAEFLEPKDDVARAQGRTLKFTAQLDVERFPQGLEAKAQVEIRGIDHLASKIGMSASDIANKLSAGTLTVEGLKSAVQAAGFDPNKHIIVDLSVKNMTAQESPRLVTGVIDAQRTIRKPESFLAVKAGVTELPGKLVDEIAAKFEDKPQRVADLAGYQPLRMN